MLNLYTNISPNTGNGTHYLYTAFANYLQTLSANLLCAVVIDKYTINNGTVRVVLDETHTQENAKRVTYVVNTDNGFCYHVQSVLFQSGYALYNVSVDNWGTYIGQCQMPVIDVVKCSRNIDEGVYDAIRVTKNIEITRLPVPESLQAEYEEQVYSNYLNLEKLYIVFSLTYNVSQSSIFVSSATTLLACSVKYLWDKAKAKGTATYLDGNGNTVYENPIDIAIGIISGIYGVDAGGTTGFNNAQVTSAYLVTSQMLDLDRVRFYVESKSIYGTFDDDTPSGANTLEIKEVFIDTQYEVVIPISVDANYNYNVGTICNGLSAVRSTKNTVVKVKTTPSRSGLSIVALCGDNQKDITSDFVLNITTNDGAAIGAKGTSDAVKTASAALTGTVAVKAASSAAASAMGAVGMFAGAANALVNAITFQPPVGQIVGSGNAEVVFRRGGNPEYGLCATYPFGYIKAQSINDEHENAMRKGAYFDKYMPSLATVFDYPQLYGNESGTFVQAECVVNNVPADAQEIIKSKLYGGVILEKVANE